MPLLTVMDPFITNQPQSLVVAPGAPASFTVGGGRNCAPELHVGQERRGADERGEHQRAGEFSPEHRERADRRRRAPIPYREQCERLGSKLQCDATAAVRAG